MALCKKSAIDKELVKLYADKVTVNLSRNSEYSPEDVLNVMQMVAINNQALIKINFK